MQESRAGELEVGQCVLLLAACGGGLVVLAVTEFLTWVKGGSACGPSNLWRFEVAVVVVRRRSHLVAWCLSGDTWLFLPDLVEVRDVGACVVRLWSHVVAPVFHELLCLGGCVSRFTAFLSSFDSAFVGVPAALAALQHLVVVVVDLALTGCEFRLSEGSSPSGTASVLVEVFHWLRYVVVVLAGAFWWVFPERHLGGSGGERLLALWVDILPMLPCVCLVVFLIIFWVSQLRWWDFVCPQGREVGFISHTLWALPDGSLVSAMGVWLVVLLWKCQSCLVVSPSVWKRLIVRVLLPCFLLVARGDDAPLWCCVAKVRIVATFWWSLLPVGWTVACSLLVCFWSRWWTLTLCLASVVGVRLAVPLVGVLALRRGFLFRMRRRPIVSLLPLLSVGCSGWWCSTMGFGAVLRTMATFVAKVVVTYCPALVTVGRVALPTCGGRSGALVSLSVGLESFQAVVSVFLIDLVCAAPVELSTSDFVLCASWCVFYELSDVRLGIPFVARSWWRPPGSRGTQASVHEELLSPDQTEDKKKVCLHFSHTAENAASLGIATRLTRCDIRPIATGSSVAISEAPDLTVLGCSHILPLRLLQGLWTLTYFPQLSRPIIFWALRVSFHPLHLSPPIIFWVLRIPLTYLFLLIDPITLWILRVSFHIYLGHLTFFPMLRIPLFLFHPSLLIVDKGEVAHKTPHCPPPLYSHPSCLSGGGGISPPPLLLRALTLPSRRLSSSSLLRRLEEPAKYYQTKVPLAPLAPLAPLLLLHRTAWLIIAMQLRSSSIRPCCVIIS
ncbi:hypothetical protein Taro_049240, partial [Colocasia esculenta]|nr:hypothetical protein [Colocasia esculenta]